MAGAEYNETAQDGSDADIAIDGDTQFVGLDQRTTPDALATGYVQISQNMRMVPDPATVRKGMAKQTNDISLAGHIPLKLPFVIGPGMIIYGSAEDKISATCIFSDPGDSERTWVAMACATNMYFFSPGQAVATVSYPANEFIEATDTVDCFQGTNGIYLLRGLADTTVAIDTLVGAGTTATVTTLADHGYSTNQWVRVSGSNHAEFNIDAKITVTGLKTFTYTIASYTGAATGATLRRIKTPLFWSGIWGASFVSVGHGVISGAKIHMPPSNWGLLQANRAILQYSRNQVIVSDILGLDSYDSINGIFNIAAGQNDYLVGAYPYQDNKTLVFSRHSIDLINGINGDPANMTRQLVTDTVGCLSRRTIKQCGSNVCFLADTGVYMLQPGYELALRGNWEPLSSKIDPTVRRINATSIGGASAVYCNNRYYLAVPLDGSTRNNAILVYNFLIQEWESVDTFPAGFYADFLEVALLNNTLTVFLVSSDGGLYAYEQNEMDDFGRADQAASQQLIDARLLTRRYKFGNNDVKYFHRGIVNYKLNANSGFRAKAYMYNSDSSKDLTSCTTVLPNNITRPYLIRRRGYAMELEFTNTANRGQIINLTVSGSIFGQKTMAQR